MGRIIAALAVAMLVAGCSGTATASPADYSGMPGNGTYRMGGMDGKNWGLYTAGGGPGCKWSITSVSPYRDGQELNSGTVPRADIEPDGDTNLDGLIGDHRIVFMTNGCGAWHI